MNLTSPEFENNRQIPKKYSCEGDGINPPLSISNVPINTKSLALLVHDPDAPNGDFLHWLLWDIEPTIVEIKEGTAPLSSAEGMNDAGGQGWIAPCPPNGMHHYEFHLYALDTMLGLETMSTRAEFLLHIDGHVIGEALLVGLYEKENP